MQSKKRILYLVTGLIVMLLSGFVYAWSIMAKPIGMSRPEWTAANLSVTFTIVMVFFCIGGLIAGFLGKKFSVRQYMILAAVLFFIGFEIAGFSGKTIGLLYLGFGTLCGLAAGIAYNVVMSVLSVWFADMQGLISGIMMMGFGISSFVIGKVFAALTPSDGSDTWQTTFRWMGVVILIVLFVCSFCLKYPKQERTDFTKIKIEENEFIETDCDMNPAQMMKTKSFWFYYLWAVLIGAAGLAVVSQGNGIAGEVASGMTDKNLATITGLLSLFNGIGRVIFGKLFDKKGYRFTIISDMVIFVLAIALIACAIISGNVGILIVAFIVYGMAYGGVTPLGSAVISDFFGKTYYSKNFSIVTTTLMIASVASVVSGKLYDSSQSYLSTIILALVLWAIGFVLSFGIRKHQK